MSYDSNRKIGGMTPTIIQESKAAPSPAEEVVSSVASGKLPKHIDPTPSVDPIDTELETRARVMAEEMVSKLVANGQITGQVKPGVISWASNTVAFTIVLLLATLITAFKSLGKASVWTGKKVAGVAAHKYHLIKGGADQGIHDSARIVTVLTVMSGLTAGGAKLYQLHPEYFGWAVALFKGLLLF